MKPAADIYSPAVRLAHALAAGLLAALGWTGLRLAWLAEADWMSPGFARLVDRLTPRGSVIEWHVGLGVTLAALGLFYLLYLLLSGEARRLFNLFSPRPYSFTKKVFYLLSLATGLVAIVSGVTMYAGLYRGPDGFIFNQLLHHWCFRLLVLFALFHLLDVIVTGRSSLNDIFFRRPRPGSVRPLLLLLSLPVAVVFGITLFVLLHKPYRLLCREQNRVAVIDGREYDIEWIGCDSVVVQTHGGANFESSSAPVTVKAFRTARRIFMLLRWPDPTWFYNRYLVRTADGWREELSEYPDLFGEDIFSEDKLAVSFHRDDGGCAASCHIRTPGRMGLHYTGGDTADVWVWMAVSTNPAREADDRWWGGHVDSLTGGRHFDNKAAGGYRSNYDQQWQHPYFLPTNRAMSRWIWYRSTAWKPWQFDEDTFSVGSRVPAVLVAPTTGDRGDLVARGGWSDGIWTVELSRSISTGSPYDLPMTGVLHLGVALFENADSKHAYHLRPIRLEVE